MAQVEKKLADEIVKVSCRQVQEGLRYRKPRFTDIKKNYDLYNEIARPTLAGRFNVPIDSVMVQGFVQSMLSKIDNPPKIIYKNVKPEDLFAARKISAAWEVESAPDAGNWAQTDLEVKRHAIMSGRGIFKYFADSANGKYSSHLETVDPFDFVTEPNGGNRLSAHIFKYQMNIWKTEKDLREGGDAGNYDKTQVRKLLLADTNAKRKVLSSTELENKSSIIMSAGFDPRLNNYVGENVFKLTEGNLLYKGVKYYVLFDMDTRMWLRVEPFEDVFESKLDQFVSWATDVDPYNFWSRAPVDMIRPAVESSRILFNQTLDNIQKRNWEMKAFDATMLPNPEQLRTRPDGLVRMKVPAGKSIQQGLYTLPTNDTTGITLNLMTYMQNFLGTETGMPAGAKGVSDEDKVGIHFSNLQQVADRLGLTNKLYSQAWVELGDRFQWGLFEHMPQDLMVEYIGSEGNEWDIIRKDDVNAELKTQIVGGNAEEILDEIKSRKQENALNKFLNAGLGKLANERVLSEEILRKGEFDEPTIKALLDKVSEGSSEVVARAEQAIVQIIRGKEAKVWRGANTFFIQYIVDYAVENRLNSNPQKAIEIFERLTAYAESHFTFAQENVERQARQLRRKAALTPADGEEGKANQTTEIESEPLLPDVGEAGKAAVADVALETA